MAIIAPQRLGIFPSTKTIKYLLSISGTPPPLSIHCIPNVLVWPSGCLPSYRTRGSGCLPNYRTRDERCRVVVIPPTTRWIPRLVISAAPSYANLVPLLECAIELAPSTRGRVYKIFYYPIAT